MNQIRATFGKNSDETKMGVEWLGVPKSGALLENTDWSMKTMGLGGNCEETEIGFHGSEDQNEAPCGRKE